MMPLRDKFYLRFGLFHQRYGRLWAALLEGIVVGAIATVALIFVAGAILFIYGMVDGYMEAEAEVKKAKEETKSMERTLIQCMNGGYVGKTNTAAIICRGAEDVRL